MQGWERILLQTKTFYLLMELYGLWEWAMVGFNKNSLDLYRGATNFCLGLRYLLRLPFTHTHTHIYIYIYIYIYIGAELEILVWGGRG